MWGSQALPLEPNPHRALRKKKVWGGKECPWNLGWMKAVSVLCVGFLSGVVLRAHFSLLLIYSFRCFTFGQGSFKKSLSGNLSLYSLFQVPLRKLVPRWSGLEKWKLGINLFPEKMWGERNRCHDSASVTLWIL